MTPEYPSPTNGIPGMGKRGGSLMHDGYYVATLIVNGKERECEHKHQSGGAALECAWRLRAVAIAEGEVKAEPVEWTTGMRRRA